jgi:hypothetical protein
MITKVTMNMCGTLTPDGSADVAATGLLRQPIGEKRKPEGGGTSSGRAPAGCGRTREHPASSMKQQPGQHQHVDEDVAPNPKKAFQSPGVHNAGLKSDLPAVPVALVLIVISHYANVFKISGESAPVPRLNSRPSRRCRPGP